MPKRQAPPTGTPCRHSSETIESCRLGEPQPEILPAEWDRRPAGEARGHGPQLTKWDGSSAVRPGSK